MSTATRPLSGARQRWLSRGRAFGILYLAVGAGLLLAGLRTEPGVISSMGLGIIGKPPPVRVPVPTGPALLLFGALLAGAGIFSLVRRLEERQENTLLGASFGAFVLALLIAAAEGSGLDLVGMIKDSVRLATPIVLGALAGVMCERCGVINIAIEGMMLTAACLGYTVSLFTQSVWLGLAFAVISGGLMAGLHAVLSIRFRVDQIVSGTAINILAVGITGYIRKAFLLGNPFGAPGLLPYVFRDTPLWNVPILGTILFQYQPMVYAAILLVPAIWFLLFRTTWGLRTRAVGEHPRAADTLGINVFKVRYVNVILAGCIAGLGGAWFSLETVGSFDDLMTSGKGFIALAAMIFGNWNPVGASFGALLFGFADALAFKLQILEVGIPYQFINMTPYILTMIALAGIIGRTVPPAADGAPYEKQ
ncbi:MAG: ABC transporter permease [Chloroflexi bacterium]|nr:ABC transporter permease [Chloroflexota bacterium]